MRSTWADRLLLILVHEKQSNSNNITTQTHVPLFVKSHYYVASLSLSLSLTKNLCKGWHLACPCLSNLSLSLSLTKNLCKEWHLACLCLSNLILSLSLSYMYIYGCADCRAKEIETWEKELLQ